MRIPLLTSVCLLALSTSAVAQLRFCIGGNLDEITPAQVTACQAKSAALRTEARLHGAPEDWHFVVVCDEAGWTEYASLTGNHKAAVLQAVNNTDRDLRFTFVRGSRVDAGDTHNLDLVLASLNESVSHTNKLKPIPAAQPVASRSWLSASGGPGPKLERP